MAAGSAMCVKDRCMLKKFRPQLIESMIINEVFLSHLIQKGILNSYHYEDIKIIPHSHDKVGRLLDYLEKGGPHSFAYFIYTLNLTQPFLAEMLDQDLTQRWKEVKDEKAERILLREVTEKNQQQEKGDMESIHWKKPKISLDTPDSDADVKKCHVSKRPNSHLTELIKELEKNFTHNQQDFMINSSYYTTCSAINAELTSINKELDSTVYDKEYLEYICYYSNDILRLLPMITEIVEIYDAFWDLIQDALCVTSFSAILIDAKVVKYTTRCLVKKPDCHSALLSLHVIALTSPKFLVCIDTFYTITKQLEHGDQETSYISCRILACIIECPEYVLPEIMKNDLIIEMWKTIKSWDVKSRMASVDTPDFIKCQNFMCSSEPILHFLAAWIMQYFIYQDGKKYVPLIERDIGQMLMLNILSKKDLHPDIKTLLTPLFFQLHVI